MTRPSVEVPPELSAALAKDPKAKALFDRMPPSHQLEYAHHVSEAKRADTRARRAAAAIPMILRWGEDRAAKVR